MEAKHISFCTTCKGRLWQLRQTIEHNLALLDNASDIVLLDYQSPDGLEDYILTKFDYQLQTGKLKYFKMVDDYAYTCSYAKNVVHRLSTGDILFNLDGDNYLHPDLFLELRNLKENEWLIPKCSSMLDGSYGRIGYHRQTFFDICGYDETLVGMLADDGVLNNTLIKKGFRWVSSKVDSTPIQNTREQKDLYVNDGNLILNYPNKSPPVNYPFDWGIAKVTDVNGNIINTRYLK